MGSKSEDWAISSQVARTAKGSTAIPEGSRTKQSEVHGIRFNRRIVIWSRLHRDMQHLKKMSAI